MGNSYVRDVRLESEERRSHDNSEYIEWIEKKRKKGKRKTKRKKTKRKKERKINRKKERKTNRKNESKKGSNVKKDI